MTTEFGLPPEEEATLRLWWHVLRPDRLRIAAEIDRVAREYHRSSPDAEAALCHVARWLRSTAGEPDPDPDEHAADKWSRLTEFADGAA